MDEQKPVAEVLQQAFIDQEMAIEQHRMWSTIYTSALVGSAKGQTTTELVNDAAHIADEAIELRTERSKALAKELGAKFAEAKAQAETEAMVVEETKVVQ